MMEDKVEYVRGTGRIINNDNYRREGNGYWKEVGEEYVCKRDDNERRE